MIVYRFGVEQGTERRWFRLEGERLTVSTTRSIHGPYRTADDGDWYTFWYNAKKMAEGKKGSSGPALSSGPHVEIEEE